MFRRYIPLLYAVILSGSLACCCQRTRENHEAQSPDRVILTTPGRAPVEVIVEAVRSPEERARGLMGRKRLDPLHGMLFIFPEERQLTFWMKDTLIELDMIFIRSDMSVLGCVERAEPMTTTSRFVHGNSQYVLEVIGGFCGEHGIGEFTRVKLVLPGLNIHQ